MLENHLVHADVVGFCEGVIHEALGEGDADASGVRAGLGEGAVVVALAASEAEACEWFEGETRAEEYLDVL